MAETFHLFPLLPAELRLLIFSFALLPRIINIRSIRQDFLLPPLTKNANTVPPLFAVNSEARTYAMKHYAFFLSSGDARGFQTASHYFYNALDSLYIPLVRTYKLRMWKVNKRYANTKHLTFTFDDFCQIASHSLSFGYKRLQVFTELETVDVMKSSSRFLQEQSCDYYVDITAKMNPVVRSMFQTVVDKVNNPVDADGVVTPRPKLVQLRYLQPVWFDDWKCRDVLMVCEKCDTAVIRVRPKNDGHYAVKVVMKYDLSALEAQAVAEYKRNPALDSNTLCYMPFPLLSEHLLAKAQRIQRGDGDDLVSMTNRWRESSSVVVSQER